MKALPDAAIFKSVANSHEYLAAIQRKVDEGQDS